MATVEFIQKRIEGKEKELTKLTKKMERIEKAEATNWEVNPYYYDSYDKKCCAREIETCKKALEDYKNQLRIEEEKNNSRNVKPILDFLENWKNMIFNFYHRGLVEAFNDYAKVLEARDEYYEFTRTCYEKYTTYAELSEARKVAEDKYNAVRDEWNENLNGKFETVIINPNGRYSWEREKKVKVENGIYESYKAYIVGFKTIEEAEAKLNKDLTLDANAMYDDIINRTNKIVGTITDASYLSIGAKGELNGYIIGERGKASVNTIGAGGYNIQKFHFRTLIHEIK